MPVPGGISKNDWLRPSVLALLLANLVPVFGVLVFHWQIFPLMFLFWSENVIIGAFNVLKMLTANPGSPAGWAEKCFIIPFFCVHYGMFTLVHGIFVIALFGGGLEHHMAFPDPGTFWRVMQENHLGWAVLGLVISRGISFAANYLGDGEYKRASLQQLMGQPYGRIVVLHLAILFGGFLMMALHSPAWGLLLLVALKIALDLRGHLAERRKFAVTGAVKAG
ncbi:MAG TPA: DUF6498-containing protein [Verrucomicrobiae bacterium]|nr:DUF6498-containing protein [Verrucomicrobiae bacterium]